MSDPKPPQEPRDVVLVGPPLGDEAAPTRHSVLRFRRGDDDEARVEVGELRQAEEGKPIYGELVGLKRREEHDRLFDVEVLAKGLEAAPRPRSGPPMVSSDSYRDGWERTFKKPGELAN